MCIAALLMPWCATVPSNYFPIRLPLSLQPSPWAGAFGIPTAALYVPPYKPPPLPLLPPLQQSQHPKQGALTTRAAFSSSHHQALAQLCLTEENRLVTNVTSSFEKLVASHAAVIRTGTLLSKNTFWIEVVLHCLRLCCVFAFLLHISFYLLFDRPTPQPVFQQHSGLHSQSTKATTQTRKCVLEQLTTACQPLN